MGLYFGKRPTFITACSLLFVCCIWQALAQSFESLLAGTIVGAFAGAATEVLVPATVNVRLAQLSEILQHSSRLAKRVLGHLLPP